VTHRSPHSVVGTLCPVKEGTASQMTRTFYEQLATSRADTSIDVAAALHKAT
jgi:hypothetical protein